MKKIYILAAVIALLSLSLNAQVETKQQNQHVQVQKAELKGLSRTAQDGNISFNDMLRGTIKGMSSILPEGQGQMRAPFRYDATQYFTLGPFEGDNFDFGFGFPGAYDANQDVTITTQLQQSEYENHIGDEIVGFRLALYGNGNRVAKVDEFVVHPSTSTSILNGGYAWALKDLTYVDPEGGSGGSQQQATYNDVVIRPSGNAVNFTRISVVSGNTTITEWVYPTSSLPSTWTASANFTVSAQYGAGYTTGTITIPGNLLTGYENVQVVIEAYGDNDNQSITVGTQKPITTSSDTYTWDISPSGYSAPTIIEYQTVERYERITSTADLTSGGQYLIVYEGGSRAFNGGLTTTLNSASNFISVSITDNTIPANETTDAAAFTITASGNNYTIRGTGNYYIGRTSNSSGMNTSTTTAYTNTITFNNGNAVIRGSGNGTNYYLRYNTTWPGFRYYTSNSQQAIQLYKRVTTVVPVEVEVPESGTVDGNYVNLRTGQWHEFYLDQPVEFQMPSEATSMLMGYDYLQYPSSNTTQELNPAAFNSQSTGHNHIVHLMQGSSNFDASGNIVITIPGGYNVSFYIIAVYDGDTGNVLTSWTGNDAIGGTYGNNNTPYYTLPTGWSLTGASYLAQESVSAGDETYYFGYVSTTQQASINIANSLLQGKTNIDVFIVAVAWEEGETVSVNGSSQSIEYYSFTECEWDNLFNAPVEGWYGFSTNPAGDLAVQLIFKEGKTPSPTITGQVDPNDENYYVITATGDGTVTLTVGNQTVTGNGTASITIPRTDVDQNITATATAQETGKAVSDPATQSFTIPAIPKTATPTLNIVDNGNGTYTITATGDGTVTLTAGGQTASGDGSASITIVRSLEDQIVTATATAQENGKLISDTATGNYTIPALAGDPAAAKDGLLRMHLLIVDQLKEQIPDDNSHPDRYGYVLKWEQPVNPADRKESGTVQVPIQKTEAQVNGYYTLDQIDADVNVGINHDLGLTMDVLTADASMFLPGENPDVLYYQMQGKEGTLPALNEDYLTQLQYMKNVKKYEEMLATSPNKTHQYPANDTYHYYDDSEPIVTGIYNDITSFMTYAPSVSTWGIQRRYFEVDHLDNTYGAPIWKTAVGQVKLNSAVHERQINQWNSVNWTDEGGNACSLYILDQIEAEGYLPHTGISNVEYEPYMFRVFVESKNGKLRPYTVVPQGDGDHDGEHLVAGTGTTTGPICVWSGYYMDGDVNGMTFSGPRASETVSGQMKYVFTKVKEDRSSDNVENPWTDFSDPWNDFDTITDPETGAIIKIIDTNRGKANAMFGALDNLAEIIGTDEQGRPVYAPVSEDDLKVFVRFYYVAAGTADGHVPASRGGGADYPAGYGTESPGKAPSPWTIVHELQYHGEIVSQTYVNVQGMQSDRPFEGVNIVITRYSDGTTSTTKVIR